MNTLQVQVTNESDWANAITLDRSALNFGEIMDELDSEGSPSGLIGIEAVTYDALGCLRSIIGLKAPLKAESLKKMTEVAWKTSDSSENEMMMAWFECLLISQKPFSGRNEVQIGVFNEWFDSGVVTLNGASRETISSATDRPKWFSEGAKLPLIIERIFHHPLKHWRSKTASCLKDGRHFIDIEHVEEFIANR